MAEELTITCKTPILSDQYLHTYQTANRDNLLKKNLHTPADNGWQYHERMIARASRQSSKQ